MSEPTPDLSALYRRAVVGAARGALPGGGSGARGGLPAHVAGADGVRADGALLADYQHLLGEPGTDVLPAGFVHVLAFPLAMSIMVRDDFPLPVLGMVHVANRVVQHRPVTLTEPLTLAARAENLRPHKRGTQVDLVATASVDGETVWAGASTYLAKGRFLPAADAEASTAHGGPAADGGGSTGAGAGEPDPAAITGEPVARLRFDAAGVREYARVSGDRNPIHTSRLAARAFGFPTVIAHGMYTAARALAVLGRERGGAFTWEVEFGKPVVLPATVELVTARDADGWRYTGRGRRSGRSHLTGTVTPL